MRNPFLLSIISAILLSVGWLGISGIPLLLAFVPLLIISGGYDRSRRSFWKMFGWVALTFALWSGSTTWWIWYAAPIGAILSVLITLGLFGGMFMLFHYVSKRAPKHLSYTLLVAGWIACELLYTVGEISFPWLVLGNGFANDIKLIQWYDTTGVFGGSLWVLITNLLVYEAIVSRRSLAWIAPAVAIFFPAGVSLIRYTTYKQPGEKVKVTVVQPNFEPYFEKFVLSQERQNEIFLSLINEAPVDVDFILLPETALDDDFYEGWLGQHPALMQYRDLLETKYTGAQLITGAMLSKIYAPGEKVTSTARNSNDIWYDYYNSAMTIDSSDSVQIYHKTNMVVGVERMPYYNFFRKLDFIQNIIIDMGGISGQLGEGSGGKVLHHGQGNYTAGVGICWDGVYGEFMSRFAANGAQILFIISNDGWWEDTQGYRQLFLFSRLRALESRRAIARSANTGISGFIDQRGTILSKTEWDERIALTDEIVLNDRVTFYTKYGDYIARLCAYVFGLCALYYIAYRVRKRNQLVE